MSGTNLTEIDNGTLVLAGTNSFGGILNVRQGTLVVLTPLSGNPALQIALGAVDLSALGATTATFPSLSGSGSLILPTGGIMSFGGDNSSTSFSGAISGTGEFRKSGTGTLLLQTQSNYSGAQPKSPVEPSSWQRATPCRRARILLCRLHRHAGSGGLQSNHRRSSRVTQTASSVPVINSAPTLSTLTINSAASTILPYNGTITGKTALVFNNLLKGAGGWQFTGNDSFSGGLTVSGGTLELTNSRSFTGGININTGGTLLADSDAALGSASNAITLNGGTFSIGQSQSSSRNITVGVQGGAINVNANTVTYTGTISSLGSSLATNGTGTLLVTANEPMFGIVSVSNNLTLTGAAGAMTSVNNFTVNPGGTLTVDDSTSAPSGVGRIADFASLTMAGGTFSLLGQGGASTSETLGQLQVTTGASTISVSNNTNTINFTSLDTSNRAGGTVNFVGNSLANTQHITISSQSAGFIGGWATVNGTDFASYTTTGNAEA